MKTAKRVVSMAAVVLLVTAFVVPAQNPPGINGGPPVLSWAITHSPAANSQATISQAAVAGRRHVARCISFSATATTAPALTAVSVVIRDGATGAGTVKWEFTVVFPAATGQSVAPHSVCPEGIVGTTNTAMTVEFSAGVTSVKEAVNLTGYTIE